MQGEGEVTERSYDSRLARPKMKASSGEPLPYEDDPLRSIARGSALVHLGSRRSYHSDIKYRCGGPAGTETRRQTYALRDCPHRANLHSDACRRFITNVRGTSTHVATAIPNRPGARLVSSSQAARLRSEPSLALACVAGAQDTGE